MKGFYQVLTTLKESLLNDPSVNTVTTGDLTRIDTYKQTMFPLSHIVVNSVTNEDNVLRFNMSILAMDVVDVSKEEVTDIFIGNDNEQDVLHTQLTVLNKLAQKLRKGDLRDELYALDGNPSFEAFYDRFESKIAGWSMSFDMLIPNNVDIC